MDNNDISFESLLHNAEFKRGQSAESMRAAAIFDIFLREHFPDREEREKVDKATAAYVYDSENAAFEQGFSFAVKLIKFIYSAG